MGFAFTSRDMAYLNDKDRAWFSEKIQSAITSIQTSDWIKKEINAAVDSLRPKRWRKAADYIVAVGSPIAICALITALLAIAFGALYQSTSHVKEETEFRTHTSDDLKNIHDQLTVIRTLMVALQPLRKENQDSAKELIAQAKQKIIPPIPEAAVKQAGISFVDASPKNPGAWNVALDFVSYRSSINMLSTPPRTRIYPAPGAKISTSYRLNFVLPDGATKPLPGPEVQYVGDAPGQPITVAQSGAARIELLSKPEKQSEPLGMGQFVLKGGALALGDMYLRHVALDHVEIYYSDGDFRLEDVQFVNCIFKLTNTPNARRLANALLGPSPVTLLPTRI